jgi:hypothetical protein
MITERATLAQLVERLIRNQQVAGSIPAGGSITLIKSNISKCYDGRATGLTVVLTVAGFSVCSLFEFFISASRPSMAAPVS